MTRKTRVRLNYVKTFAIFMFTAVFALLAIPFGALKGLRRSATAEVETATDTGDAPAPVLTSADGATYTLKFNYYNKDKTNYGKWNLWSWAAGYEGAQYDFTETTIDGNRWLSTEVTFPDLVPEGESVVGVIVRHSGWTKAVDHDVFVTTEYFTYDEDADKYTAEVYMADNIDEVYKNAKDAIDHKIIRKITNATFSDFNTVSLTLNYGAEETSVFKLKSGDQTIATASVANEGFKKGDKKVTFKLDESFEFSFSKTYTVFDEPTVTFDEEKHFPKRAVAISGLYDTEAFEEKYGYKGTLGAEYSATETKFTVWSPAATSLKVKIYDAGESGVGTEYPMTAGTKGEWTATVTGDLNGKYYTYVVNNGTTEKEIVDPYARSAGRNGKRGMILDLDSTDPEGWATHARPAARGSYSNAIIYETHIRDLTMHESSNVSAEHKGKFLGLTERASEENGNKKTPLDHIVELGVTEVHILPMYDINSVDEYTGNAVFNGTKQYNWGYDPLNYNVPEGSYSTDPTDGAVRVKELKQMVMALHEAGIRVIMDVVYNHVADAKGSNFQALMPNYYFRTNADGSFTSGSGCGNDTASERIMYHKFMVESVNYWADEYKLDGFRFDLMGLHDTLTMNEIYDTLAAKNPDIMVYGEGWEMGTMVETADKKKADMFHAKLMPNIAFFDDITRDALKGGGFGKKMTAKGFIEGAKRDASIYVGAAGGGANKDAGYSSLGKRSWSVSPTQNINYVSCHDNASLWDKINACATDADENKLKAMNRVAAAAVLTSQGPAFFLAGEEMLRTKTVDPATVDKDENGKYIVDEESGAHSDSTNDSRPYPWLTDPDYFFSDNSYKSPDSVNAIDWTLAETNADMVDFYKQLIALRKATPQFRISSKEDLDACLTIADAKLTDGITSYAIKDPDSNEYVIVLFNVTDEAAEVKIPEGNYSVYVDGDKASATEPLSTATGNTFTVGSFCAVVLKAELTPEIVAAWKEEIKPTPVTPTPTPGDNTDKDNTGDKTEAKDDESNLGLALGLGIGIPAVVLIAGGVVFGMMYSKKKKGKGGNSDNTEAPEQPKEENTPEENSENSEE